MPSKNKYTCYAVRRGHTTGIFIDWPLVQKAVHGFKGAEYKGFATRTQAEQWLNNDIVPPPTMSENIGKSFAHTVSPELQAELLRIAQLQNHGGNKLVVNVDGSALSNGTPRARAGFGVWFAPDSFINVSKRLDPKVYNQTNQVSELCAASWALTMCSAYPYPIVLRSDSKYVIKSMTEWIHGWKKNGWLTASKTPVVNEKHIKMLDALIQSRPPSGPVSFEWVKGHSGDVGNLGADKLARSAALEGI